MSYPKSEMQDDFIGARISHQMRHYRKHPDRIRKRRMRHYYKNRDENLVRQRESKYKNNYGISIDQFNDMHSAQGGVCAICGKESTDGKSLHVDHCHDTGSVRGLLCNRCNPALGALGDSVEMLSKAIRYLEKYNG